MHQVKQAGRLANNALALNSLILQATTKNHSSSHHTQFQHFQEYNSIRLSKKWKINYSNLWCFFYLFNQQNASLQKAERKTKWKVRNSPNIYFITLMFTNQTWVRVLSGLHIKPRTLAVCPPYSTFKYDLQYLEVGTRERCLWRWLRF
jgi:hypothetical protein